MWWQKNPSNDRPWSPDQTILPSAEIDGDLVHVRDIRNCAYRSRTEYTVRYYDKTFDLKEIVRMWYVLETDHKDTPHTFVSFEFNPHVFVGISIEIRKKAGEVFSPFRACLNEYELMYVIGDENDLVKLRSNYRLHPVYVYPVKARKTFVRAFFLDMLKRVNGLKQTPELYDILTNSCAYNLFRHVNAVAPGFLTWHRCVLFPGKSDSFLHQLGLIDSDLPLKELREKSCINERAEKYADSPDFSVKIRR